MLPWWGLPGCTCGLPRLEPLIRWGRPEKTRTKFATERIQDMVFDRLTIGTDRSSFGASPPEPKSEPPGRTEEGG